MKLQIKVIPSSSRDCIAGWLDDTLKVKVKAPPDKGKANTAVVRTIEKSLDLPKGSVHIESGLTSSRKTVVINCDDDNGIKNRLTNFFDK